MKILQLSKSLNYLNHEPLGITTLLNKENFNPDRKLCLETSVCSLLGLTSLAKEIDLKDKTIHYITGSYVELNSNVLLVEDTPILQVVHKKMLENLGLHVELAKTGEEALKKINESTYKLIFMDIRLPGISGIEATTEIRRLLSSKKHTPIIAITAFADQQTKQACLDAGINLVVNKPIKQEEIFELVSYYY